MNVDPVELAAQLADEVDGQIRTVRPLAPFTSYKIGGPTAVWVAPVTNAGVGRALGIIHEKKHRYLFSVGVQIYWFRTTAGTGLPFTWVKILAIQPLIAGRRKCWPAPF